MKIFSRCRPLTRADELYECPGCGRSFHYTSLDELGFCPTCREDKLTDEMEEEGKDGKLRDEPRV